MMRKRRIKKIQIESETSIKNALAAGWDFRRNQIEDFNGNQLAHTCSTDLTILETLESHSSTRAN